MILICDDCGKEVDGNVCKNCGLVMIEHPFAYGNENFPQRRIDIATLIAADIMGLEHPLSPKIRKGGYDFQVKYQKKPRDYIYLKAYEQVCKICSRLSMPNIVRYEALNIFQNIQRMDDRFFMKFKLSPVYLACVKIACKIHDFPISNIELAQMIDYKVRNGNKKNMGYMEKKFNRAYRNIIHLLGLYLKRKKQPNYIDYVCSNLELPYEFTKHIHQKYGHLRKYFQPHFKIEGYILALVYIYGRDRFNIHMNLLGKKFYVSTLTISNRRNEILKKFKVIIKFKNGESRIIKKAVWMDFIGNITIHGSMSREREEFDWNEVDEVIVRCQ